jgi:Cu/Ag efflux pump CusA
VGISVVWVEFDWGSDIYAARQIVSEKVLLIAGDLPPGVGRPILAPISSIMGEILFLGLTSDRHSGIELRTVAETTIRRRLLSVPGVSQVTPIGGGDKQYQVLLSPTKLQAYSLSLDQVRRALAASNDNVSAGFLVSGGAEYLVTGVGRLRTIDDITQVVVEAVNGVPVRIADLGVVRIDEAPKRGEGSVNMQPGIILGVQKQPGANTLTLTRTLDAVLDDLQAKLPEGMHINRRLFRQADFIDVAIENVLHALRDGGILVIIVVLFFLANLRATVITLTAIPLSLLVAVLVSGGLRCSWSMRPASRSARPLSLLRWSSSWCFCPCSSSRASRDVSCNPSASPTWFP